MCLYAARSRRARLLKLAAPRGTQPLYGGSFVRLSEKWIARPLVFRGLSPLIVDFQHHLSPDQSVDLDRPRAVYSYGIPVHTQHKGLIGLEAHIEMMDEVGIDVSVLTSSSGMRGQPDAALAADEKLSAICRKEPERMRFLAHVALGDEYFVEVKRRLSECPGAVVPSSFGNIGLDDQKLEPLYDLLEAQGKYLFVHPAIVTSESEASQYPAYDLYRAVGREFSLIMATTRLICGGVLDRHPGLQIVMSHFGGGIPFVEPRVSHYQDKVMWGLSGDPIHGKTAREPFENYLNRIYFDTAGYFGDLRPMRMAMLVIPKERIVLGTDYPQEIRDTTPIKKLIEALRSEGMAGNGAALVDV